MAETFATGMDASMLAREPCGDRPRLLGAFSVPPCAFRRNMR